MDSTLSASLRSDLAQQCVRCGLCLPHCPTYNLAHNEAESPRGRIALMAALAESPALLGLGAQAHLDSCLSCRRCEPVCPAHVQVDSLLLQTRAVLPPELGWKENAALWLMAHKPMLNMMLETYRIAHDFLPKRWRPLPKPAVKRPLTPQASHSAVFAGCVADSFEHNARVALITLLRTCGETAEIPATQVCCGQAASHAGDVKTTDRLSTQNQQAFAGYDRLLVLASGCFSALECSVGIPVLDACQYLQTHANSLRFRSADGLRVAVHTPCSASFQQSQGASLALLKRIPNLHIIELPNQGCCGAAGLHQISQPERAKQLRTPILTAIESHQVDIILSQNIGCRLHLANGIALPVQHPLEFMAQFLHEL